MPYPWCTGHSIKIKFLLETRTISGLTSSVSSFSLNYMDDLETCEWASKNPFIDFIDVQESIFISRTNEKLYTLSPSFMEI